MRQVMLICGWLMLLVLPAALAQQSGPTSPGLLGRPEPSKPASPPAPVQVPEQRLQLGAPNVPTPPARFAPLPWLTRPGRSPAGLPLPAAPAAQPGPNPESGPSTNRLPFDFRQAQLRKVDNSWKILLGTRTLKDFGPHERAARDALRAIQFYQFNEYHTLGDGDPQFEFFLTNGQAPRGRLLNQQPLPLHPATLAVRRIDKAWWLTQAERPLFHFATQEEARAALELIRRYKFDQVCFLGHPEPVMTYFTRMR
jgi:hypothetical protein